MDAFHSGADTLFIMLGAIMILAMHAGFAFLELGTVRKKNQVNALVKILVDFAVSTMAYFFVGYYIAYGVHFFVGAEELSAKSGFEMVKFFFLLTFAAAIPAIISGGIAERARFNPQRHYEIYQVSATDGITADDIRDMFESSPQMAADTIRQLGHCYFSDREQEDRVVIR